LHVINFISGSLQLFLVVLVYVDMISCTTLLGVTLTAVQTVNNCIP